jgi:hypothetical protein
MAIVALYATGDLTQRSWAYSAPPAIKINETIRTKTRLTFFSFQGANVQSHTLSRVAGA